MSLLYKNIRSSLTCVTSNKAGSEVQDENVKVVPMSDEDFEDENENRNEFDLPTFTSEW